MGKLNTVFAMLFVLLLLLPSCAVNRDSVEKNEMDDLPKSSWLMKGRSNAESAASYFFYDYSLNSSPKITFESASKYASLEAVIEEIKKMPVTYHVSPILGSCQNNPEKDFPIIMSIDKNDWLAIINALGKDDARIK